MNAKTDFGQFITEQRIKSSMKCQDLAQKVGISTAYLSQLEHGIRFNPEPTLLLKIAKALDLTTEEATILFDQYADSSGQIPPDITTYLVGNKTVQQAIRQARDANATEEDWKYFIEQLKK